MLRYTCMYTIVMAYRNMGTWLYCKEANMRKTRAGSYTIEVVAEYKDVENIHAPQLIPPETWQQEKANMRRHARKFRKGRKRFKHFRRR